MTRSLRTSPLWVRLALTACDHRNGVGASRRTSLAAHTEMPMGLVLWEGIFMRSRVYSGLLSPSKDREHRLGHRGFCVSCAYITLRGSRPRHSIFGWLATFVSLNLHAQPQIPNPQSPIQLCQASPAKTCFIEPQACSSSKEKTVLVISQQ